MEHTVQSRHSGPRPTVPATVSWHREFGSAGRRDSRPPIHGPVFEAGHVLHSADMYPMGGEWDNTRRSSGKLAAAQARRRFILSTKPEERTGPGAPGRQGGSRKHLLDAIDYSLRRGGDPTTSTIYQLPSTTRYPLDETPAVSTPLSAPAKPAISRLELSGLPLARAVGRTELCTSPVSRSVATRYNLLFRQVARELLPLPARDRHGVNPFKPRQGVLLLGK